MMNRRSFLGQQTNKIVFINSTVITSNEILYQVKDTTKHRSHLSQ